MDTKGVDGEMLIISREQVKALSDRLKNPGQLASCLEEIKKMLEIKSTLLWRADAAHACVGTGYSSCLYVEVQTLESVLGALDHGDAANGASFLDEYITMLP